MSTSERVPTCREVVELVTDYLEGTLAPELRERMEMHLTVCAACRAYLEQMRETIALTGRIEEEELSADTRAGLLDAFRELRS